MDVTENYIVYYNSDGTVMDSINLTAVGRARRDPVVPGSVGAATLDAACGPLPLLSDRERYDTADFVSVFGAYLAAADAAASVP